MRRESLTPDPSPEARERGEIEPRSHQIVKTAARELRKQPTKSERLLWGVLRNRGLASRKFRRQHPIGRFVLDFYCPEERLAIEVDGSIHDAAVVADFDRQRQLAALGIRIVRLSASDVENNLAWALSQIALALDNAPRFGSPLSRASGEGPGVRDP